MYPSLEVLLKRVEGEREKQLSHFEAVDSRAALVIAVSGLLLSVSGAVGDGWRIGLTISALATSSAALSAFWPRYFPVLRPLQLRRYMNESEAETMLVLFDTYEVMIQRGAEILERKGRRLRLSLLLLVASSTLAGIGVLEGQGT